MTDEEEVTRQESVWGGVIKGPDIIQLYFVLGRVKISPAVLYCEARVVLKLQRRHMGCRGSGSVSPSFPRVVPSA